MFWTYILYSETSNKFYTGLTNSLSRRLKEHNSGQVKSTKAYMPWKIVHKESFYTLAEARKREKFLKSGAGREWRDVYIPR